MKYLLALGFLGVASAQTSYTCSTDDPDIYYPCDKPCHEIGISICNFQSGYCGIVQNEHGFDECMCSGDYCPGGFRGVVELTGFDVDEIVVGAMSMYGNNPSNDYGGKLISDFGSSETDPVRIQECARRCSLTLSAQAGTLFGVQLKNNDCFCAADTFAERSASDQNFAGTAAGWYQYDLTVAVVDDNSETTTTTEAPAEAPAHECNDNTACNFVEGSSSATDCTYAAHTGDYENPDWGTYYGCDRACDTISTGGCSMQFSYCSVQSKFGQDQCRCKPGGYCPNAVDDISIEGYTLDAYLLNAVIPGGIVPAAGGILSAFGSGPTDPLRLAECARICIDEGYSGSIQIYKPHTCQCAPKTLAEGEADGSITSSPDMHHFDLRWHPPFHFDTDSLKAAWTTCYNFAFGSDGSKCYVCSDGEVVASDDACADSSTGVFISDWDTSHVTSMKQLFMNKGSFNQDISGWVTSDVTDMESMFYYANDFNQDISGWDVSKVTTFKDMFYRANNFNQDLSPWGVTSTPDLENMFRSSGMSYTLCWITKQGGYKTFRGAACEEGVYCTNNDYCPKCLAEGECGGQAEEAPTEAPTTTAAPTEAPETTDTTNPCLAITNAEEYINTQCCEC